MPHRIARICEPLLRLLRPAAGRHRRPDHPSASLVEASTVSPAPAAPVLRGEDAGLVRPYLAAHDRREEQKRQARRRTLRLAVRGIDIDHRLIHAAEVPACKSGTGQLRLLPWAEPGGKPCYLSGDGTGYLSRLADSMEATQLGLAEELLQEAKHALEKRQWTPGELHLLAVQLTEALGSVHRIAVSRGARLQTPADDDPDAADHLKDADGEQDDSRPDAYR
ncbi:hypothetical protein [Streptomyces poriticola]|uniref:hypothetical protein n=1 Tax=Streptomyces poriticola TaxID=3120506 RepID=UPI002FCE036F